MGSSVSNPQLLAKGRRKRPLISLTPLIDVVFILLVFFMLASSFLDWRAIDLDAPVRTGSGITDTPALLIEIESGGLSVAGSPITSEDLTGKVESALAERPDRPVLIAPAPGIALQQTIDVLDAVRGAEAGTIRLVHPAETVGSAGERD